MHYDTDAVWFCPNCHSKALLGTIQRHHINAIENVIYIGLFQLRCNRCHHIVNFYTNMSKEAPIKYDTLMLSPICTTSQFYIRHLMRAQYIPRGIEPLSDTDAAELVKTMKDYAGTDYLLKGEIPYNGNVMPGM